MTRVVYRLGPAQGMPGVLGGATARNRLRRTCTELGILHAEPIDVAWTDKDEDGTTSLTERWIVASAYVARLP